MKSHDIFGLRTSPKQAKINLISVPWEGTVTYRKGTAKGPENIRLASPQIEVYHDDFPQLYKLGISIESRETPFKTSDEVLAWTTTQVKKKLAQDKLVGLVGGEHSITEGAIIAFAEQYTHFGILQIDAHMDLRHAYESVPHSHASVMKNCIQLPQVSQLYQVGVRDFCQEEMNLATAHPNIKFMSDATIKSALFQGQTWDSICQEIIQHLPQNIYITFDIDGLHPSLCPDTGTPVPGGLQVEDVFYLFKKIVDSGRKIIGIDLVEVAGEKDSINMIVAARVLYWLCGYMAKSHNLTVI